MAKTAIESLALYWRPDNEKAANWSAKISSWLKRKYPSVRISSPTADDTVDAQVLLVLGGDGTILEAAKRFHRSDPVILGLNLGNVGFLAAVRKERDFLAGLEKMLSGEYRISKRMVLRVSVIRQKKEVFSTIALNEALVQNPVGMVSITVAVDGHPVQYVRGTGFIAATPNGSTGYNLSAHGPILMPDMECMILSEILDHNIPTPPIVIKGSSEIELTVTDFRERGLLTLARTKKPLDVILAADNAELFPLARNDVIRITRSPNAAAFAEIERNYFLKSLQEKFGYK